MPTHTAVPMKKNYIKIPVRDFVSPLEAAWSLLKAIDPQHMYEELPDEAFMRRDEREEMRRQAAVKEAVARIMARPRTGPKLSQKERAEQQRKLDEERRVEEAMYPNPEPVRVRRLSRTIENYNPNVDESVR